MPVTKLVQARDFFKIWTSDVAYVMGLLFADGCITTRAGHPIGLVLELKDVDHLEAIARVIDPMLAVHGYERPDGRVSAKFEIRVQEVVQDVMRMGMEPRKSFVKKWPEQLPDELYADFVRGYFDGNGTLSFPQVGMLSTGTRLSFSTGSFEFVKSLKSVIAHEVGYTGGTQVKKTSYSLTFSNVAAVEGVGLWMYYSGGKLKLSRKFEKWQLAAARPMYSQPMHIGK